MEYGGKTFEGLRAYCFLRKEERTFRLDRILDLKIIEPEKKTRKKQSSH